MTERISDGWDASQTYDDFMGRWSRPLAIEFLRWFRPTAGWHWLDVGTGTGALASAICRLADPATVVGCDPSASFVEGAKRAVDDARLTYVVGGSGDLPLRDGGYDAVVSGLALNFFPNPSLAVEEQLGSLRRGGRIGAFVWDYAEGMEFLRYFWDAATDVVPRAESLDEGRRFPMCNPSALESLFRVARIQEIRVGEISIPTDFSSFEDYWRPLRGGTGPAPSFVASLTQDERHDLATKLREHLPTDADGRITLSAKAWAVAGTAA